MGVNSKIEIQILFTPNFFVSSIYYKLYNFDINADEEFEWATHLRNFSGRIHWFALIDQKFMSEYKGRSRFVLGNI